MLPGRTVRAENRSSAMSETKIRAVLIGSQRGAFGLSRQLQYSRPLSFFQRVQEGDLAGRVRALSVDLP